MAALCLKVAFFALCLFIGAQAQDPIPFPEMSRIEVEFYQTEVQVTDVEQQATAFATEYVDKTQNRGKLEVLALGNRASVYYYNETNEILEVNSTTCQTWDIDESIYDYVPVFYGWLNKVPLVVGPSAALWYAETRREEAMYRGQEKIRDITCDKFVLLIEGKRDNVSLTYYFATEEWTTPYQIEGLRVPIRIVAEGVSSKYSAKEDQWAPINIVTDFAYFRPTITDWLAFQPPVGVGCPLRKPTKVIPKIPKTFKFSAEMFDFMKATKQIDSDVEYHQIWYDSTRKIARLDKYTRVRYTSELYDFNTGVTYSNMNGETCTIKPLRNSYFETYDGQLMGHIKEPSEVLNLDGTFYSMGRRRIRGIMTDSFESIKQDVFFMDKTLEKLVITVYFTREFLEVAVDGETETRVPIYYLITGWSNATNIAIKMQYNIFGFDDVIWPQMYSSFRLGACFPLAEDRSYFVLAMNVNTEIATKMEDQDESVILQLRSQISKYAEISDMRVPFLRADYKTTGVYVTGLMLNRPPSLNQFWLEYEGETTTNDPNVKTIVEAATKEQCATACIDESDFICTGFYFCNKACFLKSRDMLDKGSEDDKTIDMGDKCQTYLRAEEDSSNYREKYLADALKTLEAAVLNESISVTIQMAENVQDIIPVREIVIGEGPYEGDNQEKPYITVINYAKLKAKVQTTEEQSDVDTLNDCYKSCKNSESMACASFSYCPDASNKQCLTSSVLIVDRKVNPDDTEDDKNCYVYSLKYLDFYQPYPGKVVLLSGDDVYNDVKAAEECAKKCREEKKFQCRGFEYCRSAKTCVLHSKHVLDLKAGEVTTSSKKGQCTHFAAKFSADYYDMGYTLIDDDSDKRSEISLEECARACSEELKGNCKSFNYCPASGPYMTDSSCALSSKMLADSRVTTTVKDKCHHFEKKEIVEDWAQTNKKSLVTKGYTSNGFAGLVIGMLALGLVVGAIAFVTYSYFRSRNSGEGLSVRFMKQET